MRLSEFLNIGDKQEKVKNSRSEYKINHENKNMVLKCFNVYYDFLLLFDCTFFILKEINYQL
jgi:hypothetical protein